MDTPSCHLKDLGPFFYSVRLCGRSRKNLGVVHVSAFSVVMDAGIVGLAGSLVPQSSLRC